MNVRWLKINKEKWLGIHVIVAGLLSLGWIILCPVYYVEGQLSPEVREIKRGDRYIKTLAYYRLDFERYLAGEMAIWSLVAGSYLAFKHPNGKPQTSVGTQRDADDLRNP
jgi:hypothetical protein